MCAYIYACVRREILVLAIPTVSYTGLYVPADDARVGRDKRPGQQPIVQQEATLATI